MNSKEFYIESFKTYESKLNGDSKSFLHQLRKDALKQFRETNFPTLRNEEWKYTDISSIVKLNFTPAINSTPERFTKEQINKFLFKDFDCHLLVFVNGIYSEELSLINNLPKGVVVGSLKKLAKENPSVIDSYIGKLSKIDNAFNALNTAYAVDGLVIVVPDGKILEKPIQVLYLNSSSDETMLASPRNLIVVGKNTRFRMNLMKHTTSRKFKLHKRRTVC